MCSHGANQFPPGLEGSALRGKYCHIPAQTPTPYWTPYMAKHQQATCTPDFSTDIHGLRTRYLTSHNTLSPFLCSFLFLHCHALPCAHHSLLRSHLVTSPWHRNLLITIQYLHYGLHLRLPRGHLTSSQINTLLSS